MNVLRLSMLAAAAVLVAAMGTVADDSPVNSVCPLMKGKPLRAGITSVYEGKTIGFCCNKCKKRFDADPKACIENSADLQAIFSQPAGPAIGKKAPEFALKDTDGKDVKTADFKGKIVVLEWLSADCAACKRLGTAGLLGKLGKDVKGLKDDATVLPVLSNDGADAKAFAKFLADNKVDGKGLVDADGKVAKAFFATNTPYAVVIDGEGNLRYAGAIDDDADGKKGAKATNYVLAAVKSIVAGEKVATETSKPYGTEIKFKK